MVVRKIYLLDHILYTDCSSRSAEIATGIVVGCLPILPRFFKEYAPGRRTSSTTDRRRKPSFLIKQFTRVAKNKGFRKDSKTVSSYTETQDPRLHSLHSNLPQTPAQTYNNISIRTSETFRSYEDGNDHGLDERDESYIRLDDAERGGHVRKRSPVGPGTFPL